MSCMHIHRNYRYVYNTCACAHAHTHTHTHTHRVPQQNPDGFTGWGTGKCRLVQSVSDLWALQRRA